MIAGFKQYTAMKDSGVEWLGDVPAHWDVRRLGQIGTLLKGRGGSKEDEVEDGIPCVRYGDLYTTHTWAITETRSRLAPTKAGEYTSIRFGDVLFAASGETTDEIGKSAVNLICSRACCGGDIILFRARLQLDPRFMGYAADCRAAAAQKASMGRGFTVVHIYPHQIKRVALAIPPLPEQSAIASFLDQATSRIDRYIRTKERLIALLEEYKQLLVQDTVTGRIDIRTGRPYPEYKDAGVQWLGEVPKHWDVRRAKRVFRPRNEYARPGDTQLSATQAYGVIAQARYEKKIGRKVTRIVRHLDKRRHVEVNDFVISMRSFQGGLERAWESGCIRSSYIVLRPTTKVDVGYFSHLFKSLGYISALQITANFIRDGQDLNYSNFCAVDLPFPPKTEQQEMSDALDRRTEDINLSIRQSCRQMELVREYGTRLIADVVTGKLNVREATSEPPDLNSVSYGSGNETVHAESNPRLPNITLGQEANP